MGLYTIPHYSYPRRPVLILFGDSLTQRGYEFYQNGWVAQVANLFSRRVDVVNRALSGYNSRWAKFVVDDTFSEFTYLVTSESGKRKRDIVVALWFGTNDAALEEKNPHQHVPIHEYENNMKYMVKRIKYYLPEAKVLIVSIPPLDEDRQDQRTIQSAQKYNERLELLTQEMRLSHCVSYCNLYNALMSGRYIADYKKCFADDGLHFNAVGNRNVLKIVFPQILKMFNPPASDPFDSLLTFNDDLVAGSIGDKTSTWPPLVYPPWRLIDSKNPSRIFTDLYSSSSCSATQDEYSEIRK